MSEGELIEKAKEGDNEALENLLKECNQKLVKIIGLFNIIPHEIEDLKQEIWIKIWKEIRGYKGKSCFHAWVLRIARRHCVSHVRKKSMLLS